jgi:2-hydroxychromene-2-carboxylate isomerase
MPEPASRSAGIEYFYAAHSAFAYIGSARFMAIARAAGRRILHRPFDLGAVMAAVGSPGFSERSAAYRAYFFGREIARWAEYRGVPIINHRPSHHDNDIAPANRMIIAADRLNGQADALAHALLEAHWRDDADLADEHTLAQRASSLGLEAATLLAEANSPAVRQIYDDNTNEVIKRSVFGSPSYFVDADMFYGQDRLELVERALKQPFAGTWQPPAPVS